MNTIGKLSVIVLLLMLVAQNAQAQNWLLNISGGPYGTPVDAAGGLTGDQASLYGEIFNFTGTGVSNDGNGGSAPSTALDFAGISFIQNFSQYDLGSIFTPDASLFAQPIPGSSDGYTPGDSGILPLGYFELGGLQPGTYQEDFDVSAFPDDYSSSVPFDDLYGTITVNVSNNAPAPEATTVIFFSLGLIALGGTVIVSRRKTIRRAKP